MNVDLLVDLVVIIWGSLILITLVLVIVLGFLLFRQIKSVGNSIKATVDTAKEMRSDVVQAFKSSKDVFTLVKSEKVGGSAQAGSQKDKEKSVT